ncbi:hypothetical protein DBR32_13205 [Taibaiella sp. KBW10]|uniref:bestrophin family protein n=1 Tax=Taibaiella sp. KBW10 TaxID=2153357 RepID=UPI000F5B5EBB|nr:bestrophin family ion channel [Taibaiella sp. KBW10]RQO30516.1 hypothetical protein DBR32_13205 [Taibaiella sp. KBW10]
MIIRERVSWFRMLFIMRGSILPKIGFQLLGLFAFSALVTYYKGIVFGLNLSMNPFAFTLIGIALAIFLGFCNTAAYDRFWEGRKLWGALVIDTRSIIRQVKAYVKEGTAAEDRLSYFTKLTIAYTYALKHQLREEEAGTDLQRLLPEQLLHVITPIKFKPVFLLDEMAAFLQRAQEQGRIDVYTKMQIDQNLNNLSTIVGGCERIHNTPIPFPYYLLLHRTIYIYSLLLPFGLLGTLGWLTPFITTFISYTFIGLDAVIDEIKEPFGTEPNDLALNALSETVEFSLCEMAGLPLPPVRKQEAIKID